MKSIGIEAVAPVSFAKNFSVISHAATPSQSALPIVYCKLEKSWEWRLKMSMKGTCDQ